MLKLKQKQFFNRLCPLPTWNTAMHYFLAWQDKVCVRLFPSVTLICQNFVLRISWFFVSTYRSLKRQNIHFEKDKYFGKIYILCYLGKKHSKCPNIEIYLKFQKKMLSLVLATNDLRRNAFWDISWQNIPQVWENTCSWDTIKSSRYQSHCRILLKKKC